MVIWCRYGRVLVAVKGRDHARARLRTSKGIDAEVDGIRKSSSHHAFRPFMSLLGSVFDEECVGAVQNEPTCVFPSEKLVEFQVMRGCSCGGRRRSYADVDPVKTKLPTVRFGCKPAFQTQSST